MKIRLLQESDFDAGLYDIINFFTRIVSADEDLMKTQYNKFCNEYIKTYVVVLDNTIVGTGRLIIEPKIHNNGKNMAHIEDVVVQQEFCSRGIGKMLIEFLVSVAQENNCYKTVLNCSTENISFYQQMGFAVKGVEMCIYHN
jgi:glucosamine-phosphate N-acetyltransferase